MIFKELALKGVYFIEPQYMRDERGFFARTFCRKEFEKLGLNSHWEQCSISYNIKRGTLRGMHYQLAPYSETKLVSCLQGGIYDVVVDLRPQSATFLKWIAVELWASARSSIYIPEGFAHGFQTLEDHTDVFYQISAPHQPTAARGLRWNDPAFAIHWPLPIEVISQKDTQYSDFSQIIVG